MATAAPRQAACLWRGLARGVMLAAAFLATGAGAQETAVSSPCESTCYSYAGPTTRYPHGVLGDAVEWETLQSDPGSRLNLSLTLDLDHVFEDLNPRIADLDGDGQHEIITIRSHQNFGAQLAIYGPDPVNQTFELLATTPYIGRRNRWLAPAGIADFNGDGLMDIAYVDRPHLAKTLRIVTYDNGTMREIANAGGFSNHRIGEAFITGGARDCGNGPEMVLADGNWRSVMVARMEGDSIMAEPVAAFSPAAVEQALDCR